MILERLPSRIVQVIPFDGLSTESQYLCENVDKKKTKRSRQLLAIASVARADRQKQLAEPVRHSPKNELP